jgi:hypothetical protein
MARGMLVLVTLAGLASCSKSGSNAMTTGATAASASAGMAQTGMSLLNQLGGMAGVTQLANAFGLKIGTNPVLSKLFDGAAITQTSQGLVNEVAKASGVAPPHAGVDLFSVLSGKGLDAAGVGELTSALSSAANEAKLDAPKKASLMGLLTPITNRLLGK